MEKIQLPVTSRDTSARPAVLRREKQIPAVVYGHGFDNLHLRMDYQTFRRAFEQATYSTIIYLNIEGQKDAVPVLVHDVQYHPVSEEITHVDFYKFRMDEKVTTHIALEFTGTSEAVKQGGILNSAKTELEISCLPTDLVHHIEVDITSLAEIGDSLHVSDIKVPEGIEVLDNPEDTVVSVIEPRVAEEPETTEDGEAEATEEGGADASEEESGEDAN